jgi:hypothetical protein
MVIDSGEITWRQLEQYEDRKLRVAGDSRSAMLVSRAVIMAARDAGLLTEDLPAWLDNIDEGDIALNRREDVVQLAAEIVTTVNVARQAPDPS